MTEFAVIKQLVPLDFHFFLFLLLFYFMSEIPFSVCCPDVTPRAVQAPLRRLGPFCITLDELKWKPATLADCIEFTFVVG